MSWLLITGQAFALLSAFYTLVILRKKELAREIFLSVAVFLLIQIQRQVGLTNLLWNTFPQPKTHLFSIPFSGPYILLYLVVGDLLFFITHWLTHKIPLLWIAHSAHHSCKFMHPTAILRGSLFDVFLAFPIPFYFATAVLGFFPLQLFFCYRLVSVYQAFTHIEGFRRWRYLDWLFVTPQSHSIHHNLNKAGVTNNYGGILSIWDSIFGTRKTENSGTYGIHDLEEVPNSFWNTQIYVLYKIYLRCSAQTSLWPLFSFRAQSGRSVVSQERLIASGNKT